MHALGRTAEICCIFSCIVSVAASPQSPRLAAFADEFKGPESALHDAEQDLWFVTNINGLSAVKDGNGFISRLSAEGKVTELQFIAGGRKA